MADITAYVNACYIDVSPEPLGIWIQVLLDDIEIDVATPNETVNVGVVIFPSAIGVKATAERTQKEFNDIPSANISFDPTIIEDVYEDGIDYIDSTIAQFPQQSQDTLIPDSDTTPRWSSHSWRFPDNWTEGVVTMREWLSQIKAVLNSAKGVLNAVRSVINTIRRFLVFFQDTLKAFVKLLADMIDRYVTDIKSTGVYFLDMTTYHFFEDNDPQYDDVVLSGAWWKKELTDIEREELIKRARGRLGRSASIGGFEWNDVPSFSELYNAPPDPMSHNTAQRVMNELFNYKMETYDEFIEKICFHFTNPKDYVHPTLQFDIDKLNNPKAITLLKPGSDWAGEKTLYDRWGEKATTEFKKSPWAIFSSGGGLKNLRTGVPDFGPNATLSVTVIAVAFPDITQLFELIWALVGDGKSGGIIGEIMPGLKQISDKSKQVWTAIWRNPMKQFTITTRMYPQRSPKDEWPYWIGVSLNNLFPFIWDAIDELLDYLRSFSITVETTILDTIDRTLKKIIDEINKFIKLIEIIDRILEFIQLLMNIPSFSILTFKSHTGTEGAVEAIRSATGFFENQMDDIRDIEKIKNNIQENLNNQKNKYQHWNNFERGKDTQELGAVGETIRYIDEGFNVWLDRYNVIKNIHNYVLSANLMGLITNLTQGKIDLTYAQDQKEYWEDYKQALIDASAPQEEIDAAQGWIDYWQEKIEEYETDIGVYEGDWDDAFDIIEKYQADLPDEGIGLNRDEKETDADTYNLTINGYIVYGETAKDEGILYLEKMMIDLNNRRKEIFETDSENDDADLAMLQSLRIYYNKAEKSLDDAEKYVEKELSDNVDLMDSRLESAQLYDPNRKMMFAGIVMAMGYPSKDDLTDSTYFDLGEFNEAVKVQNEEHWKKVKDKWENVDSEYNATKESLKYFEGFF